MTFQNILVPLDGSKNSQRAAEYAFWIASRLESEITGQHVVDPRLVELFIEPEFGEELGLSASVETSEKVYQALRKIGKVVLDSFQKEGKARNLNVDTRLDEGHIADQIIDIAKDFDLIVMGHRRVAEGKRPANLILGSVAERVTVAASCPVLIAVQPVEEIDQVLVAYDGSEASRGALLMAENFAKNAGLKLKAITVFSSEEHKSDTKFLVQQGESFLREYWAEDVFSIKQGCPATTLLQSLNDSKSLLVFGAYGFKEPDRSVLGSTAQKIIREADKSVLVYRPNLQVVGKDTRSKKAAKAKQATVAK